MRRLRYVAAIAALSIVLPACTAASPITGLPATAAATVAGTEIPLELFERVMDAQRESRAGELQGLEGDALNDALAGMERQILTALIQFELVRQAVVDRGIEVTTEMIDAEYQSQIQASGRDEAEVVSEIEAATGLTVDEYRELIIGNGVRDQLLRESLASEIDISDQDVRDLYDQRAAAGQYELGVVSHILISPETDDAGEVTEEARAAAEQQAQDLLAQLADGADFAALAEEFSADPGSAANGGTLPESPLSNYVAEFADAARTAPVGEVVGPVETQFGFHLVRVDSRTTSSFDDVADTLRSELVGQQSDLAYQDAIDELFTNGDIEVAGRFGTWDPTQQSVVSDEPLDN